ncbi:MAG: 1-acyl-sn-glycerol-3-phosphate acyltransferase [Thermaceae bacterium]|nr:1-acyl-sn-glycerol-3-phosphate acyltransferase [Thermaceae bacterium]
MKRPWQQLLFLAFGLLFRRTVQTGLRGVWVRGALPGGAFVLAANHHSWWDAYVLPVLLLHLRREFSVIMSDRRLGEFGFFRFVGGVAASRPRQALSALKRGEVVLVFPEGELSPSGSLRTLNEGAVWLAKKAGLPIVPVATSVLLRAQEFPEAYVDIGMPMEPDGEQLKQVLSGMIAGLDDILHTVPAEEWMPGFGLQISGRKSTHERMAWWSSALLKLMGVRRI